LIKHKWQNDGGKKLFFIKIMRLVVQIVMAVDMDTAISKGLQIN
jgi:hypothetical protein